MAKDPALEVLSTEPFKAQSPLGRLIEAPITPRELFYVCTHSTILASGEETFRLEVTGMVERPLRLRLADLKANFAEVEVTATLQSAANRRDELSRVRALEGQTPWGASAIGTAVWRGLSLAALLQGAGPLDGAAHVAFTALDQDAQDGERFGCSIPFARAMAGDVVLAWDMNGEPLLPEHGFPLRAVVPGWIGARSVKWLTRIEVRREPSDNLHQQQRGNKLFPTHVDATSVDWSQGLSLGELSLTSAICDPLDGAELANGPVRVRGYALAGGQRTVERVEVSADNGSSWTIATLAGEAAPGVWRLWEATLELPPGPHELVCRAWDSAAMTQPEDPAHLWNFLGLMNNAWHRVRVWMPDTE
ncbi:MAG TPA: molybdopterin-dependent oxidoreductase [Thermoanaerobaculia bacterium]|nr:molybdopterin-dependent oxidoreductase [Thermoanaerobaculia bacterium]